jgi:hypothetical protein
MRGAVDGQGRNFRFNFFLQNLAKKDVRSAHALVIRASLSRIIHNEDPSFLFSSDIGDPKTMNILSKLHIATIGVEERHENKTQ